MELCKEPIERATRDRIVWRSGIVSHGAHEVSWQGSTINVSQVASVDGIFVSSGRFSKSRL